LGGHRRMNKTYKVIKSKFSWRHMGRETVREMSKEQITKSAKRGASGNYHNSETPIWEMLFRCSGTMPETKGGNKYILTFQDDLTKFVIAGPIPQKDAGT
jgi:hypothetical protein